ncbi:DNA-directed RNA polymerase subunit A' [archaeon]|jgi:DNA-directed RNA polymerase subunit A'|nr:DNA-directed RNA polymerase subunit A' [archaeon]MBT4373414.1 DNA-directed RNA polymerase subunit A' [archaeon]MBT4531862.1 DNA-directed RNA polymerase subunit A' [archaeon]MBT7001529.1 DNA-directed RNA polymerase subunit A' [archaeon]MBT7282579.1 DNA-directed RNA polymerase subunit A' [archaeon]
MAPKIIRKKIKNIKFSLVSPEKIKKISSAKIVTPELYDIDGYPVDGGLMDLRMGAVDPGVRCRTCGGRLKECLGHPGSIDLARPVMHLKYIPLVEIALRSFCHDCGKLLLNEEKMKKYSLSERAKKAKDVKKCPYCGVEHPRVKLEKPTSFYIGKKRLFPTQVREMLTNIPDEEFEKIGVDPNSARPEWAILTMLLVPPVTIRPSIILESGERSEDDLTHKLSDIIRANQRLWENLNAGAPEVIIEDLWDLLQFHITTFFDNTTTRIPPARHRSGQPLKTITERIKGKEGRIRKNLAGKRVNYSARSVVSPDPSLEINEVGVPYEIAEIVTFAETVNDLNIEKLKKLIKKGKEYPGANYIIRPDGKRKKITEELKEEIIEELDIGYRVERHLQDGDIVLFNRHPSLHRGSLMAHYVKVLPGRTFRLHPAATFPYNADFDGDEMNIHSPQTEEARAEAKILLDVKQNLISPKNNTNLLGTQADSITGGYLLGLAELTKAEANQLLYNSGIDSEITKKQITGLDIISEVIPKIDFKNSSIVVKGGKIESGVVDKTAFAEEDGELVKELDRNLGRIEAVGTLKKVFDLGTKYLTSRGITISVEDLDLSEDVVKEGEEIIKKSEKKTQEILQSYNEKTLEIIPGKTAEESREIKVLQTLNEIRTKIGAIVKEKFPATNPVSHMIKSGGGGNVLNITQMASCVGQQAFMGGRIGIGYNDRTLSFFKKGDLSPRSRGFIHSPFIKGLRPDEFFFQAITGRDSLMDTALRTPKSGYLYRRLANALQDLRVEYDGTVRDSGNRIIQFKFGEDGKDVCKLHLNDGQVEFGEAIGLITAQSFGESSTQMVLNTFHMAGVAEMQVTSGLPRLIEIFDARKKPSSPKMEIYLEKEYNNEKDARVFAEKIKEVKLKEISSEINLDFSEKNIEIIINKKGLQQTHTSIKKITERLEDLGFKVKEKPDAIKVNAEEFNFKEIYKLKEKLKDTIISGVKGVEQILVAKKESNYVIMTLGTNLDEVLKLKEVNKKKIVSNDLHEVAKVLGIEAARQLIMDEVNEVLNSQGIDIDKRHLKLISDAMCNTGEVKGVTRMGIIAQKSSILARATFETPVKQFINASIKGSQDNLTSVVENIIINQPVPVGTGLPGLLVNVIGPLIKKDKDKKTAKAKTVDNANK